MKTFLCIFCTTYCWKLHTIFRWGPTSLTLNNFERRNGPYFALFHRIRQLYRPITLRWWKIDLYCLQNIVFHFWPKLTHPAARSFCDSSATCCFRRRNSPTIAKDAVQQITFVFILHNRYSGVCHRVTPTTLRLQTHTCNIIIVKNIYKARLNV